MTESVSQADRAFAEGEAKKHGDPVYPSLTYTEAHPEWVLLYMHMRRGQIEPKKLKRLRNVDLEYMAAHPSPHPALLQDDGAIGQAMKIVENVTRATRVLQGRAQVRAAVIVAAIAAGIGAFVGWLIPQFIEHGAPAWWPWS